MELLIKLRQRPYVIPAVLAVVVILLPQFGAGTNIERQVILAAILVLLTSGLNLSLGFAGELALGQVAMYAAGAYVAGYMGTHGQTDILLQLLAAGGVAVLVGVVTGIPGLRLGSWSLAMTSFFLVLLIPDFLTSFTAQTGGSQGLVGISTATLFGHILSSDGFYIMVTVVTVLWLWVMRNLVVSRHGTAFRVLRQSTVLASSLGISVYRMKLTAYALGALPAGLAGCFFANLDHYLSPDSFGFALSITIVAASILGGSTSIYGAVLGAAILQLGPQESNAFQQYALVVYGAFLLIGGVLLGSGISGLCDSVVAKFDRWLYRNQQRVSEKAEPITSVPGVELSVENIGKSFGGLRALNGVTLSAKPGAITAIIGPNGSGKTTLLNMICGYYELDEGVVRINGVERPRDVRPDEVARSGVARTFQTANIPEGISVLEAVRSGRYTTERSPMIAAILRLPGFRRVAANDTKEALATLRQVGIAELADQEAASLPLGTRRLLEVARALVRQPGVLLLDEAASGLDEKEVGQLADLLRRVRDGGGTVVLVEHNFRLILSLADEIFVLAEGALIAQGPPSVIETHPRVLQEYLGIKDPKVENRLRGVIAEEVEG